MSFQNLFQYGLNISNRKFSLNQNNFICLKMMNSLDRNMLFKIKNVAFVHKHLLKIVLFDNVVVSQKKNTVFLFCLFLTT